MTYFQRTKMQLRKKWENMRTEYKRQLKKANVKKKNIINEPNLVKNTNHDKNATVTSPERVDFDNDSASNTFDTFDEEESLEYTSELNTTYSNTSYTSSNLLAILYLLFILKVCMFFPLSISVICELH